MTPAEMIRICKNCERHGTPVMFRLPWVPTSQAQCIQLCRDKGPRTDDWSLTGDGSVVAYFNPRHVREFIQNVAAPGSR